MEPTRCSDTSEEEPSLGAVNGRPPSVDSVVRQLVGTGLPHTVLVDLAREAIAAAGPSPKPVLVSEVASQLAGRYRRRLLQPVVNATGVLLHTNLGRAPVAVTRSAEYSNLEYDLLLGERGSRSDHAAALLAKACGAEAALVVNNGAAALLLALSVLAAGRDVVVSRGELVEIGGGFRVPEVMTSSGARLVEVGTTNRTRRADYAAAISAETALTLKVHTSNYRITGFTESVSVDDLAYLGPPVVVDLGSGLLDERCPWLKGGPPPWLAGEPGAHQALASGASLVTFSGDKLLGGPQAGVIAGGRELVDQCRRHPLARALRPGGLVLEALQDVVLSYLRRDVEQCVPLWRMALAPLPELRRRAEGLNVGEVVECGSVMGGGTLPGVTIPSIGVAVDGDWSDRLRTFSTPVVARVNAGRTVCDLRSVLEGQDPILAKALSP
ncbi:MAG TPA: L-seryl-tRNA(Sec) selenium transferase [Acidimicrobiales bacterium]|nr:L-seryl-tRNA(Sec) selenium transferase [Acidimicrobiales bacterium]